MDKRILKTKENLSDALIKILKNKSIYDISIKELCDEAKINRTTFYKHYRNQFDLLTEMENWFLDEIRAKFGSQFLIKSSFINIVTDILGFIKRNKTFAKLLAINNIDKDFENKLIRIPFSRYYPYYHNDEIDKTYANIAYEYTISGCSAVIRRWLENDCDLAVEKLAKYIFELVNYR